MITRYSTAEHVLFASVLRVIKRSLSNCNSNSNSVLYRFRWTFWRLWKTLASFTVDLAISTVALNLFWRSRLCWNFWRALSTASSFMQMSIIGLSLHLSRYRRSDIIRIIGCIGPSFWEETFSTLVKASCDNPVIKPMLDRSVNASTRDISISVVPIFVLYHLGIFRLNTALKLADKAVESRILDTQKSKGASDSLGAKGD